VEAFLLARETSGRFDRGLPLPGQEGVAERAAVRHAAGAAAIRVAEPDDPASAAGRRRIGQCAS
jgi:hypothetical protein